MNGADLRWCRGCLYLGRAGMEPVCDYILMEKKMRGCPVGVGCEKRIGKGGQPIVRKVWDEARARVLWEEGKSDIDIADMVGATAPAIASWRHRNGLKSNKPPRGRKETAPAVVEATAMDAAQREPEEAVTISEVKTEKNLQAGRQAAAPAIPFQDAPAQLLEVEIRYGGCSVTVRGEGAQAAALAAACLEAAAGYMTK